MHPTQSRESCSPVRASMLEIVGRAMPIRAASADRCSTKTLSSYSRFTAAPHVHSNRLPMEVVVQPVLRSSSAGRVSAFPRFTPAVLLKRPAIEQPAVTTAAESVVELPIESTATQSELSDAQSTPKTSISSAPSSPSQLSLPAPCLFDAGTQVELGTHDISIQTSRIDERIAQHVATAKFDQGTSVNMSTDVQWTPDADIPPNIPSSGTEQADNIVPSFASVIAKSAFPSSTTLPGSKSLVSAPTPVVPPTSTVPEFLKVESSAMQSIPDSVAALIARVDQQMHSVLNVPRSPSPPPLPALPVLAPASQSNDSPAVSADSSPVVSTNLSLNDSRESPVNGLAQSMFSDELTVSVLAPSLPHQSPSAALSISALSNTSYVSNSPADLSISNLNLGVKIATQQAMQSSAAVFVQSLPSHVVPLPIAPWLSHAGIPSNLINNAAQPSSATQDADDMALSQALAALHDHDMSMFASDTSSTLIRSAAEAIVHAASHGPSRSPSQSPLLTVASLTSLASSDTLHSIPSLSSLAHSPSPLDELEVEAAAASMRRRARHLAQSIIQQESGHDAARTEMTTASLDDDQDELAELHWNQTTFDRFQRLQTLFDRWRVSFVRSQRIRKLHRTLMTIYRIRARVLRSHAVNALTVHFARVGGLMRLARDFVSRVRDFRCKRRLYLLWKQRAHDFLIEKLNILVANSHWTRRNMVSVFSAWKQHVRTQLYLTQRLQHLKSVNCLREAFEGWRQLYQAKAQRRFLGDWIEHLHNQRSVAQRFALWKSGFHSRQQHWASLEHAVELRRLKVWFLQWRVLSVSLQCADFMSRGHSLRACFAHWKTALKRVRNMRQASQYRRQRLLHCLLAKWRTQLQRLAVLRSLLLQCESRRTDLRLRRTFVTWRRAFRSQITDRKLSSLVAYFQKQYRVLPRLRAWFRLSQQWAPLRKLESDFVKPTRECRLKSAIFAEWQRLLQRRRWQHAAVALADSHFASITLHRSLHRWSQALRSLRLRRALGSAAARFFRSHSLQRYVQKWRTFTARSQVDDECTAIVQHKVGKRVLRRAFQVWKSMFKMQLRLKECLRRARSYLSYLAMRNSFFKWTTRFNTLRRLHLVCQNQSKLRARRNLLRKWRSAFRTVKAVEVLSHITVRSRQRAVLKQWTRAVVGDVSDFSRPIDVFATPVVQTLEAAFEATTHRDPTHLNIGVRPGMTLHEQMQAASRIQNRCSFFIALRAWRVWMHRLEVRKCENMWLKCQQQQLRCAFQAMKELHIERQQLVKHVGSIANLRVLSEMFRCWYRIASEKRARHHQLYTSFYRSHALMRCKRQWELFMLKSRFRHARAEAARMFESRQHRLFVLSAQFRAWYHLTLRRRYQLKCLKRCVSRAAYPAQFHVVDRWRQFTNHRLSNARALSHAYQLKLSQFWTQWRRAAHQSVRVRLAHERWDNRLCGRILQQWRLAALQQRSRHAQFQLVAVPRLRSVHRQMCLSLFWRGWRQALTLKRAEKICKKNRTARRLRVLFSRWRDRFSRLGSLRLKWFNVDQRLHLNTLYHAFRGWHSMLVCLRFRRFAIQHSALARWRSRYLRLCGSRVAYQVLNAQYRAKTLGSSLLLWRILAWRQRVCRLFRQQRLLSVGSRLFFKWRTAARERSEARNMQLVFESRLHGDSPPKPNLSSTASFPAPPSARRTPRRVLFQQQSDMRSESAHNTRLHHRQKSYDENDGPLFLQPQRHSEDDVHEYLMPHNSEGRVEHQPDVDLHHIETGLHDRVHSVLSSFSTATTTTTTRSTSFYHATATESQSMSTNLSTRVLQTLNSVLSRAEAFQQQHRVRFQAIKRKMQVNVDDEDRAPIDEMTEFEKDIVKAALYYHRKLQALSALFDWLCHRQKSAFVQWKEFVQFQKEKREANKIAVTFRRRALSFRVLYSLRRSVLYDPILRQHVEKWRSHHQSNMLFDAFLIWRRTLVVSIVQRRANERADRFHALKLRYRVLSSWYLAYLRQRHLQTAFNQIKVSHENRIVRELLDQWSSMYRRRLQQVRQSEECIVHDARRLLMFVWRKWAGNWRDRMQKAEYIASKRRVISLGRAVEKWSGWAQIQTEHERKVREMLATRRVRTISAHLLAWHEHSLPLTTALRQTATAKRAHILSTSFHLWRQGYIQAQRRRAVQLLSRRVMPSMHRSFQLAALRHWSSQNQRLRAMEIQSSTWLRMKTVPRVFYWWRREAYLHKLARTSLYQRLIRLYFDKWRSHKARKMLLNAAETYLTGRRHRRQLALALKRWRHLCTRLRAMRRSSMMLVQQQKQNLPPLPTLSHDSSFRHSSNSLHQLQQHQLNRRRSVVISVSLLAPPGANISRRPSISAPVSPMKPSTSQLANSSDSLSHSLLSQAISRARRPAVHDAFSISNTPLATPIGSPLPESSSVSPSPMSASLYLPQSPPHHRRSTLSPAPPMPPGRASSFNRMSRSLPTSPLRFVIPTIREDSGAEVEEESDQQWIERQKQQQLLWNVVRDQIIARRVMREKMEAQKKEWKQWENVEEEENLNTALALYRHRNQIEESSVEAQSPEVDADSAMDVVAAQLSRAIDEMRLRGCLHAWHDATSARRLSRTLARTAQIRRALNLWQNELYYRHKYREIQLLDRRSKKKMYLRSWRIALMELNKRKNQLKLLLQTHQMLQVSVRFQQWKQAFQLRRHASAIGRRFQMATFRLSFEHWRGAFLFAQEVRRFQLRRSVTSQRRVFVAWRDEYVVPLKQSLQEFRQQQDHRTLSLMFSHWNKFSKVCLAAQAVSRKFKQLSTIRRWHRIAVIERLGRQQVMNQLSEYFAIWKHELLLKQRYLPGFVHLQRVTVAPHFHAWRQRALALSFVKYLRARVQQRLHVARCTKAICVRQIKAAFSVWRQRHLEIQDFMSRHSARRRVAAFDAWRNLHRSLAMYAQHAKIKAFMSWKCFAHFNQRDRLKLRLVHEHWMQQVHQRRDQIDSVHSLSQRYLLLSHFRRWRSTLAAHLHLQHHLRRAALHHRAASATSHFLAWRAFARRQRQLGVIYDEVSSAVQLRLKQQCWDQWLVNMRHRIAARNLSDTLIHSVCRLALASWRRYVALSRSFQRAVISHQKHALLSAWNKWRNEIEAKRAEIAWNEACQEASVYFARRRVIAKWRSAVRIRQQARQFVNNGLKIVQRQRLSFIWRVWRLHRIERLRRLSLAFQHMRSLHMQAVAHRHYLSALLQRVGATCVQRWRLWSTARIQLRGLCELTHHRNLLRTAFQEWKQQHQCRKQELVASKHHLRHLFAGLRLLYQRRSIVHEAQLLSASNRYQMSLIRSSFRALRYARAVHQVQYRIAQNHEKVVAVRVIWRRWQRMTQLALEVRAFLEKQLISKSRQFFRSWRLAFAARQLIEARGQLLRRTISDRLIAAAFTRIRSEFCARKWQAGQLQGSQSTAPPKNRGDNVSMTLLRQQSTLREFQWPSARATMLSDDE